MIDLSVIVVSWNTRGLLLDCLEGVERALAALPPEIAAETWVVDNGSEDGSAEAVRKSFPDVQLIALPENLGYAAGNNAALQQARGRISLLLNTDVVLSAEAIERALAALDEHPEAGLLGVQLLHPDGRKQNSVHAFPSLWTELIPRFALESLWPAHYPSKRLLMASPAKVEAVLGAALFVRRELVAEVGLLDEGYFFFLEETDWCWRAAQAGWVVLHLPDVSLVHLSGASSKRRYPAATRIEYHVSLYRFLELRRGSRVRRVAQRVRTLRGAFSVAALAVMACLRPGVRPQLAERLALWRWHLRGCPAGAGLGPWSTKAAENGTLPA
jgi:GT2 family glycosyltransferase